MKTEELIKITEEDLRFIVGERFAVIEDMAKHNSFCLKCIDKLDFEMTRHTIYLNELNDVIFKGYCSSCEGDLSRYIEIGEDRDLLMKTKYVKSKRKKEK